MQGDGRPPAGAWGVCPHTIPFFLQGCLRRVPQELRMNMQKQQNDYEIAQLMIQIDAEYKAGQQAISEPTQGISRRRSILARLQRISVLHEKLMDLIGEKDATRYMIAAMKRGVASQAYQ